MRDARSASQGFPPNSPNEFRIFGALARTDFSPRRRFEPKISLAQTFLAKRSESEAILSNPCATFNQFWKGSSQVFCLFERDDISSSNDFFRSNNFAFSSRYISRSISCSKYPLRSRSSLILIAEMTSLSHKQNDWLEPMKEWIKDAQSLDKIASDSDLFAKKEIGRASCRERV